MMTLMGQMGQQQDFAKGLQMLRLAAERADENAPQGAYVLGMLYIRELPQVSVPDPLLPYNEEQARLNVEKAAYLGFSKAQLKMGAAYELCTLGCDFDPALSLHYNSLAARQAEPEAEMAISKWFLCGYENVFPKNEDLAYIYAERAARSGLATAEFAMGYFNEIGMHVSVNLKTAKDWYEKAAVQGNKDAQLRIEGLSQNTALSKKDHEQVAINRIRSQYGSRRGGRPDRLRGKVPDLPPLPDEYNRPPRTSSTTPYPEDNMPPPRSSSTAPYPLENGPPQTGYGGRGGRPTSGGSAFMLNPSIQGRQGSPQYPPSGRQSAAGYRPRPGDMGYNGGGAGPRTDSMSPRPVQQQQGQPSGADIGFVAPLQPRRPQQPQGPQYPNQGPSPGGRTPQGRPGPGPQAGSGRPTPQPGPTSSGPGRGQAPGAGRGAQPGPGAGRGGSGGPGGASGRPPAPGGPGGPSGPKTFAEMGIPQQNKDNDCVSEF
jgi:TPR repeat protein